MGVLRPATILAIASLLVGSGAGCLSLSLFNHENADTETRLGALENRVTALETATGHGSTEVVSSGTLASSPLPPSPPLPPDK